MSTSQNYKIQVFCCSATFVISGFIATLGGILIPYISDEYGLTYDQGGLILSAMSIGNLISGLFNGVLGLKVGEKNAILFFNSFMFLGFTILYFIKSPIFIIVAFFMLGLGRGATSSFNNRAVNAISGGKASAISALHAMFAMGALSIPIVSVIVIGQDSSSWSNISLVMLVVSAIGFLLYFIMPPVDYGNSNSHHNKENTITNHSKLGFLTKPSFIISSSILFFYLCVEQGVIGWLVSYFRNTGLLSDSMAQLTTTVMWIAVLIGRLLVAFISHKFNKSKMLLTMGIGVMVAFILLLLSQSSMMIICSLFLFGISMAGVYPTTVSISSKIVKDYELAWSFMLTIASLGAIIMPIVIGNVADKYGIFTGISTIAVVIIIDLILMIINCKKSTQWH